MPNIRNCVPVFIKSLVWNWKHKGTTIDAAGCPHDLLDLLETMDADSAILDLGCGAGNLRAGLRLRGWKGRFIGVDVSEQAIEVARKSGDDNAEWHVSAIEKFPMFDQKVNTLCLCESIYYVQPGYIPALIERCRQAIVSPGGQIVIRIWHADRHRVHCEILAGLGAQSKPPFFIISS